MLHASRLARPTSLGPVQQPSLMALCLHDFPAPTVMMHHLSVLCPAVPCSPAHSPCRQAVLDVSRSWHAALAAAPELVPTARLSCIYDEEEDEAPFRGCNMNGMPFPQCYLDGCPKLRAALGQLRRLSPRTLRVRLEGFDWSLVRVILKINCQ